MSAKLVVVGLVAAMGITQASALNSDASESLAEKFVDFAEEEQKEDIKLGGSCKTVNEQVGPCAVEFKVCGGFYKRKFRYTATACASGKCASSGHTKSAKGAAEEAAKALFAQAPSCAVPAGETLFEVADEADSLEEEEVEEIAPEDKEILLGSSCKTVTEKVATCSVQFKVCAGFHKFKWRYTATACASGKCGSSGHTKSAKGAAEDAAKKLFAQAPACAIPPQVQDAVDAPPALQAEAEAETPMLGGLTCKKATEQVGPCSVQFEVCGKISKLKWVYTAKACASGICRSGGAHKSGKGAAEDAAKALFAVPPACALPPQ